MPDSSLKRIVMCKLCDVELHNPVHFISAEMHSQEIVIKKNWSFLLQFFMHLFLFPCINFLLGYFCQGPKSYSERDSICWLEKKCTCPSFNAALIREECFTSVIHCAIAILHPFFIPYHKAINYCFLAQKNCRADFITAIFKNLLFSLCNIF